MRGNTPRPIERNPRRAVFLTALPVEYMAVRARLTEVVEETGPRGVVYERGTFHCDADDWQVAMCQVGAGNVPAALHASWAIERYEPAVVVFVGVAGGLKDVAIGDVVAATKVYGYESGKAKATFEARPDVGQSSFRIVQRARAEARKEDWWQRIPGGARERKPRAFVAPIAAGEKVVASTRSATFRFLRQQYGDALAVEMEGRGFLEGAWPAPQVQAMVVRGISDLVDRKGETDAEGSQELASRHASAFAFQVLAELDLVVPEPEEEPPALPIWNIPYRRNPNFTGREEMLRDLRTALTSGEAAALTTQAIHGLGGVGKTQIAVEYAYRHQADYAVVWWVRAEEAAALAADYAALAAELGLPQARAEDQTVTIGAVRRWLEGSAGWLLVFDNASEQQAIHEYLPQNPSGHVLITSRNPAWRGVATCLQVKTLPRPKAVEFLLKRTGHTDAGAAGAVAEASGDLPLALEQAGAYIEETGMSLPRYLELFEAAQSEVLQRGKPSTDYPHTVATTWELSFQRVRQESPPAADLLNLCAFLAPDNVPCEILTEGSQHVPQPLRSALEAPLELQDAISALRRYSLVQVGDETLSFHRLVQAVTRDRMHEDNGRMWAKAALSIVNGAFPYRLDDVETWDASSRLVSHALAAARHAEVLEVAPEAAGRLLNEVGVYLSARAQLRQAEAVKWRAVAIAEAAYGADHPAFATYVSNLGRALYDLEDLARAQAHFERALAIHEAAYGPDHPAVAIDVNNLGMVLKDLGDLAGAHAHYERALAIDEAAFGPDHPSVARDLNNLGLLLRDLRDLTGALAHLERALAIDEAAFGPDHPNVATDLNNLGMLLEDIGDRAGARAHVERGLAIAEAAYGPDHPTVAAFLENLGNVLRHLGDLAGARAHFERALAIGEAAYGPSHPRVALRVNNLGSVLQDLGDLAGARAHLERALRIFRGAYGEDHPSTVKVRRNLEALEREQAA